MYAGPADLFLPSLLLQVKSERDTLVAALGFHNILNISEHFSSTQGFILLVP